MPKRQRNPRRRPRAARLLALVAALAVAIGAWIAARGLDRSTYGCDGKIVGEAVGDHGAQTGAPAGFRAFTPSSYWNTPLLPDAPVDPRSQAMIDFLQADGATDYIELAGADGDGRWGHPIYWSSEGDAPCKMRNSCDYHRPPEFDSVRIPEGARQDPTSDAAMTVYDTSEGIAYGFYRARYDVERNHWSACGGTVYYLDSNGLEGSLEASDDPRNFGHRGLPRRPTRCATTRSKEESSTTS